MKGGFMQVRITRYGRFIALSAVFASALALMAAKGGFTMLARVGDAVLKSYDWAISDWGQHLAEKLDPTYPRCF
jgi:hypothetical protein